jgi:peptidoglycan-N-acetylglucosamine deacetylase
VGAALVPMVVAATLSACAIRPPPLATVPTSSGSKGGPVATDSGPSGSAATGGTSASSPGTDGSPSASGASSPSSSGSAMATGSPTGGTSCPQPPAAFVDQAPGAGRTVALTFDDGPAPADMQIVPILERFGIHATFFETGRHTGDDPAVTRYVAGAGNLVEDHSWDHLYPREVAGGWTVPYLTDQFVRTRTKLSSLSGQPVCFVRPPGGFTDHVLAATAPLGMTAVSWSVDGLDWKQPGVLTSAATATIVANATSAGALDHPIVLLHSGKASHEPDTVVSPFRGNTVAALPQIITWYLDHGYTFVRLDGKA